MPRKVWRCKYQPKNFLSNFFFFKKKKKKPKIFSEQAKQTISMGAYSDHGRLILFVLYSDYPFPRNEPFSHTRYPSLMTSYMRSIHKIYGSYQYHGKETCIKILTRFEALRCFHFSHPTIYNENPTVYYYWMPICFAVSSDELFNSQNWIKQKTNIYT